MVDDEPAYLRLLGLFLKRFGFTVLAVSSGKEALPLAGQAEVALVDMVMPGLSGPETIAQLQALNPQIRVIASSGRSELEFRHELDCLGVDIFLPKPFPVESLIEHIERIVESVAA